MPFAGKIELAGPLKQPSQTPARMSVSTDQDCFYGELPEGFVAADGMAKGVKGSDVYTDGGVGDPRVALNTKLVRGAAPAVVEEGLKAVLAMGTDQAVKDAVVMAFQARDVRGGKGERKLFHEMMYVLQREKPDLAVALLDLVPEYGSWDDVFTMAAAGTMTVQLLALAAKQLKADEEVVRAYEVARATAVAAGSEAPSKPSISLLAKWAPREGKQFDTLATLFARKLAADAPAGLKQSQIMAGYRKRLSALNKYLETVEVKECANDWEEIDPKAVPARAREIKKAAYLNEKARKTGRGPVELRKPDDPVRMKCRENFQAFFKSASEGKVKISGAETLYPHEVVKKAMQAKTEEDRNSLNPVWCEMVKKAAEGGGLGRSVFMCDFSGSMEGLPMEVAKAMGLLGCAVCSGPFRGRFLTFHETPEWCEIDPDQPLTTQVTQFNMRWGGTTDFQRAGEMIIGELKKARAPPGSSPENLIVVTDMGFDAACGSSSHSAYSGASYRHNVKTAPRQTHVQMLREAFRRASEDVHGDPNAWPAPRIVIWNVAAQYSNNHQARADEEGVLTLSGWSPSLFKVLCEEGPRAVTPMEVLRLMLDAKRYDPVRQRVQEWLAGGWRGI
jgi:hypothetical protein